MQPNWIDLQCPRQVVCGENKVSKPDVPDVVAIGFELFSPLVIPKKTQAIPNGSKLGGAW
jgi:hypothetical protein